MLRGLSYVPAGSPQLLGRASGSVTLNGAITSASPVAFGSILIPGNRIVDGTRIRGKFHVNIITAATTGNKTITVRIGDESAMTNIVNLYYVTLGVTTQAWTGTFECVLRGSNLIRYTTTTVTGLGNVAGAISDVAAPDFTTNKRLWFACADLPASEAVTLSDYSVEYIR